MVDTQYELSGMERANLSMCVLHPGFQVLKLLMDIECEKTRVDLDNVNPADEKEVLAKHAMRRCAVKWYQGLIDRVNREMEEAKHAPKAIDEVYDPTEEFLGDGVLEEIAASLPDTEDIR